MVLNLEQPQPIALFINPTQVMLSWVGFMNSVIELPNTLEHLIDTHHGLITRQQVIQAGLSPHLLTYWMKAGKLERLQPGVYRLIEHQGFDQDWLIEVMLRVPQGVLCLTSALAFHELSTFVPTEMHIAIPRAAHRPVFKSPPVQLHRFSGEQYTHGIETHTVGQFELRVYSREKTLADLLRSRHVYGLALFLEGLKSYTSSKDFDTWKLAEAAQVCRVERLMREYVTVVLV